MSEAIAVAAPPAAPAAQASPAPAAPAAPAAAAPAKPETAISAAAAPAAPAPEAKGVWPEDWVTRVAKGDDKAAKMFGRYASPEALAEAHLALRRRMDSGEFKAALPKDPKPAELASWRKENGVPDKPEAYDMTGLNVPAEDKELVSSFLKTAHGSNFTPSQARVALEAFYAEQGRQVQMRQEKDVEESRSAQDALNVEYGANYRRNMNLVENILTKFPEKVREEIKHARLPNGKAIFNDVDVLRAFVALELDRNPAGIVAPSGAGDLGKTALDEYTGLQKYMREKRPEYNKDNAAQTRMRDLIDYLQKQDLIDKQGNVIEQRKKAA